jgi:cytochrome c oxidase subunit 1
MPDRSWCPLITGFGLFVMVLGFLFHQSIDASGELVRNYTLAIIGGAVFVLGVIMWAMEGPGGYHLFPKEKDE